MNVKTFNGIPYYFCMAGGNPCLFCCSKTNYIFGENFATGAAWITTKGRRLTFPETPNN